MTRKTSLSGDGSISDAATVAVGTEPDQANVTAEMRLGLNGLMAFERDKDKEHYT